MDNNNVNDNIDGGAGDGDEDYTPDEGGEESSDYEDDAFDDELDTDSQNYYDHNYFDYHEDSDSDYSDEYHPEFDVVSMSDYDNAEVVYISGDEEDEDDEMDPEEEDEENSSDTEEEDNGGGEAVAGGAGNEDANANDAEVGRRVMEFAIGEVLRRAGDIPAQLEGGFLPASAPGALETERVGREGGDGAPDPNRGAVAAVEDDDEGQGPPEKKARMDSGPAQSMVASSSSNPSEPDGCNICAELFCSAGPHVLCCLKCGHMFGKSCIEKWLVTLKHKNCPMCNTRALKKDIRILFSDQTIPIVADKTEIEDLKKKLKDAESEKSKMRLNDAILRTRIESYELEVKRLKATIATLEDASYKPVPTAASSNTLAMIPKREPVPSTSRGIPGRKSCRFQLVRQFDIKEGPCRVAAFNDEMNMLVVSHEIKNSLYPAGSGGIKQFNLLEMRPSVSLPIHGKQIRDMAFSLCQTNCLLTVSLDKKAVLFNCSGNVPVQTFQTDYPLWSCCWDEVKRHLFYVGTTNGQIIVFDIRAPSEPVGTFAVPSADSSPVCRIKFVAPAYQSSSFKMTGLIIQKLNSVWFCELNHSREVPDTKFHQLPLEGPFVNVDFEPKSRHVLISTRPSSRNQDNNNTGVHYVCNLVQVYSEAVGANVVTSNIVQTYRGGARGAQRMCRSILFSPEQGFVYAVANGDMSNAVKLWDISLSESDGGSRLISPVNDVVIDYVRGSVNNKNYLALISEKGVSIFEEIFE